MRVNNCSRACRLLFTVAIIALLKKLLEAVSFFKRFRSLVLGRQDGRDVRGPVDGQGRVVPQKAALVCRRVVVRGLVQELGRVAEHDETVRKTLGYPELVLVVGGQ